MMKNLKSIMSVLLALWIVGVMPISARPRAKRVVMIALDGISVPGFTTAHTPNLDNLLAQGALSLTTRVVMPSVTLPNWTSHLTGSGPEQHGVVDNGWQIDKKGFPAVEIDKEGYYPSVFKVMKEEIPECKTAFYYNWINLFYPYNKKYLDEVSYLENDAYVPNYEKAFDFIVRNQDLPTLVFLYSVHTDHAGHAHKWMSAEYIKSIEEADIQIGAFIDKMKKEDLELMSYNDIANLILEESTKKTTAELFKKICHLLDLGEKTYENKIGAFYTSLTKDKRFLLLDDGLWDLKKNHSVKVLKIEEALEDMEEIEETEDDEDEDKDIIYDENPDDDLGDDLDDYKNLVIVDEEDLDNIEP